MPRRIVISGAGIAGPKLAYWLSLSPANAITLPERSARLPSTGQNVDVQGSVVVVLARMGVLGRVAARATTETGTELQLEILRGHLTRISHDATAARRTARYKFGTAVASVLRIDGTGGTIALSTGDWLATRRACSSSSAQRTRDLGAFCVYYRIPRAPTDTSTFRIITALRSRNVCLRPDPNGTTRACLTLMPCSPAQNPPVVSDLVTTWPRGAGRLRPSEFVDVDWAEAPGVLTGLDGGHAADLYFQPLARRRARALALTGAGRAWPLSAHTGFRATSCRLNLHRRSTGDSDDLCRSNYAVSTPLCAFRLYPALQTRHPAER
ncbi:hypothetical protein Q5752_005041 [Cryptotrichosporon argae]